VDLSDNLAGVPLHHIALTDNGCSASGGVLAALVHMTTIKATMVLTILEAGADIH